MQSQARADELIDAFGLTDAAGRLVKHHSGGMRRRLDIAASIVATPELMFLDEPTAGLDARSRSQVWGIVRALVTEGTTVLLCTQAAARRDDHARPLPAHVPRLRRHAQHQSDHPTSSPPPGLMEGTATAGDVGLVLLSALLLIAIFAPLTVRLYRSR